MPARGKLCPGAPLAAALAAGLVVRVVRLLRDPLIHPDGPAYLDLASAVLQGKVLAVLGGYYSPLYPAAVAGVAATGLRLQPLWTTGVIRYARRISRNAGRSAEARPGRISSGR